MRTLFVFLACLFSAATAARDYSGYQVLRVTPSTNEHRQWLHDLENTMIDELDFWSDIKNVAGGTVDIMVPRWLRTSFVREFAAQNLPFRVMIEDVGKLIHEQEVEHVNRRMKTQDLASFDYTVYHTYDEIQQWVNDVVAEYPTLTERFELGQTSYEGRTISGLKIRGTGGSTGMREGVWFEGGIHAREWISPATVMYITHGLLRDYNEGLEAAVRLLDNFEWYIIPSLNVDGYVYTWTDERLWRKTRSSNFDTTNSGCMGTDPNRNWPYQWGGEGTSANPCSNVYHGAHKLCEQEVEAVVDYLRDRKTAGQNFLWFIDWHSYSQLVISPWSFSETESDPVDLSDMQAAGEAMAAAIFNRFGTEYQVGPTAKLLYAAAGASNDWGYAPYEDSKTEGGLGAKYSYVMELRDDGTYGFLLPEDQILPTALESLDGVYAMGTYIMDTEGYP